MQNEIWKDIPEYEGLYQVSNLGRVKSFKWNKEKILSPSKNSRGYLQLQIHKNSKGKSVKVHQLIAIAFLGHNFKNKLVVDHINNNPLDNRVENLQIVSQRFNSAKNRNGKTSKYIGVSWSNSRQRWVCQIQINKKNISLGQFKSEYEAHLAYQSKLKEINNIN